MSTTNGSTTRIASARCPYCHDLFVPEDSKLPTHWLDTWQGESRCGGSGAPAR